MNVEESVKASTEFKEEFLPKLNALIDQCRNADQTMPMFRQVALNEVFLTVAGFFEALCYVNTEALAEVKAELSGLPVISLQRLPMELIYEAYTVGFNNGILRVDPYRPAMRELMKRNLQKGEV